eukprot:255482-Pleurochrysis_carterae.AAC.1
MGANTRSHTQPHRIRHVQTHAEIQTPRAELPKLAVVLLSRGCAAPAWTSRGPRRRRGPSCPWLPS